jgi:hypothetical protein
MSFATAWTSSVSTDIPEKQLAFLGKRFSGKKTEDYTNTANRKYGKYGTVILRNKS